MRLINTIFLIFLLKCGLTQHPYYSRISIVDGLASNNVYCVFQDEQGLIWFGTDMGASRFNGYEFENYNTRNGLLGNEIFSIKQDSKGRIWFLSSNGEISFYKNKTFYNRENCSFLSGFNSETMLSSLAENSKGEITISSRVDGIFSFDNKNRMSHDSSSTGVNYIWYDRQDDLNLVCAKGIYKKKDGQMKQVLPYNFLVHYPRCFNAGDSLFIGYGNKVFSYYKNELKDHLILPEGEVITWLSRNSKNILEIGTRNGLYLRSAINLQDQSQEFNNLIVTGTLNDREGNFWVTTLGDGVFFSPSPDVLVYDESFNLPNSNITAVCKENDSTLWLGHSDGYFTILTNDCARTYQLNQGQNQPIKKIRSFSDGQIIVCSKSSIAYLDHGEVVHINLLANDIHIGKEKVLIASSKLYALDKNVFFKSFNQAEQSSSQIEAAILEKTVVYKRTNAICQINDSTFYFGTQTGLYLFSAGAITGLGDLDDKMQSPVNEIIYDDHRNLLYVATSTIGLLVVKDNRLVYNLNSDHGLSSDYCHSLLLEDNQLWVGTARSVDLIRQNKGKVFLENFGAMIGIKATKITDIERTGNNLYLGSDYGLISCELGHNQTLGVKPNIKLLNMYVNSYHEVALNNGVELKHHENTVTYKFVGLSYKDMGSLKYEYILEGFQKNWRKTESRNVVFEELPPGKYLFKVRTTNSRGVKSETLTHSFSINPPIWKTVWFLILIALAIIGVVVFIWKSRLKRIKNRFLVESQLVSSELEKLELEKAYLESEQKAGVLQMNPHFLFNSLNAIKGFYAEGNFKEGNRFLAKFSKLLRNILECNTQFITLEKEKDILTIYLDLMRKRYGDMFEFEVRYDSSITGDMLIPPMLIQPLVENAVIHGIAPKKSGELLVEFWIDERSLKVKIQDDGIGFGKSTSSHDSIGLKSTKDRLNLLSKQHKTECSLTVKSDNIKQGTTIILRLPLKNSRDEGNNN